MIKKIIFTIFIFSFFIAVGYFFLFQKNQTDIKIAKKDFSHSSSENITSSTSPIAVQPEHFIEPKQNAQPFKISNNIITNGQRDKKQIALTFDADMTYKMLAELKQGKVDKWYDEKIFNTLKETSTPATFFITGLWAETYPEITKDLATNPLFEIGNHSFDHAGFTESCYHLGQAKDKKAEIAKTQEIIFNLTGKTPQLFRFPGGCSTQEDFDLVYNLGLQVIGWDVSSGDAFSKSEKSVYNKTMKLTRNGSIIVMHTGGPNDPETSSALPEIIRALQEKGYSFVTVSDLLK